jgi:Mg-chelatase subunit ChlD
MLTRISFLPLGRFILTLALLAGLAASAQAFQDPYPNAPSQFFRVGKILSWADLKPDETGKRYFNLFADYSEAKQYLSRANEDVVIRSVDKTELMRTEDGRAFLAEVERVLADLKAQGVEPRHDFTLMLTSEASYQATLLNNFKEAYRPGASPAGASRESHAPVFNEIKDATPQPEAPPREAEPAAVKPEKQAAIESLLRSFDLQKLTQDRDAGNFEVFKNELFNPKSGDATDTARAWKKVCSKSEFHAHSQLLADMRWKMFVDIWATVAQENGFPIELIDSGKRNAYSSDIDVTAYVPPDKRGDVSMADIIAEVEGRFASKYGYKPDALDITIHDGDVFLPDARNNGQSVAEYTASLRRVVSQLRTKVTSGGDASYVPGANLDDVQKRGLRDGVGTLLVPEVEVVRRAPDGTPLETRFKKPTATEFRVTELGPNGELINSSTRFGGVTAAYDRSNAFGNLAQDLEKVFRNGKDPAAVAKLFNRGMAQGGGAGLINSYLDIEASNLPDTGLSPEEAARLALELEKPESRRLPPDQLQQLRERGRNKAVAKFRWIVKAFGLSPARAVPANITWLYELLNTTSQMELDKSKGKFDFQGEGRARYLKKYFARLKAADPKRAATPEGINELYEEAYREFCGEIVEAFETAMVKVMSDAMKDLTVKGMKRNSILRATKSGALNPEAALKIAEQRRVELALLFDFIERAHLEMNFDTGKKPLYLNFIGDQSERLKAMREAILENAPPELRAEIEKLDNIARTQMDNYLREVGNNNLTPEQALAAKEQIVNRIAEAGPDLVTGNELAEHLHRLMLLEANPLDWLTMQKMLDTLAESFHSSTTGTRIDPKTGQPVSRRVGAGLVEQVWENSTGLMVGSAAVNLARAYVTGGKQAVIEAAVGEAFNFLPPAYGIVGIALKDFGRGHVKEGLVALAQIGVLHGLSSLGYPGVGHAMLVYNIVSGVPQIAYTYITNNINEDMVEQALRSKRWPGKRAMRNPYKDSRDLFKGDTPEAPVFWDHPCMKSEDGDGVTPEVVRKAEHLFRPAIWKDLIAQGLTPASVQWAAEWNRQVMKYAFDLPYYQRMSKIYDCYHEQIIATRNKGFDEDSVLKSVFGKVVDDWFGSQPDGYKLEFNSVFDIGPNEGRTRKQLLDKIKAQVIGEYKRYEYVTFERIRQQEEIEKEVRARTEKIQAPEKRLIATKKLVLDRLQQKILGLMQGSQPSPATQTARVRVKAPSWYVNMSGVLQAGLTAQPEGKPAEQRTPSPSTPTSTSTNDDGAIPIEVTVQADRAAFPGHPDNWKHDYKLALAAPAESAVSRGKPAGFEPNEEERKALDKKDSDGKPLNDVFTVRLNATARAYDEKGNVIGEAKPAPVVGYFIAEVPRYRRGIEVFVHPRRPDGSVIDPEELKADIKVDDQSKPLDYSKWRASTLSMSFANIGVGPHAVTVTPSTPHFAPGTATFTIEDPYSKDALKTGNVKPELFKLVEVIVIFNPPPEEKPQAQQQPPPGQQQGQGQGGQGKPGQGSDGQGQGGQGQSGQGQGGQGQGQGGQGQGQGQGGGKPGTQGGQPGQGGQGGQGGNQPNLQAVQECQGLLSQAQQLLTSGDTAGAQRALQQAAQKNCGALDPSINQAIDNTQGQIDNTVKNIGDQINQSLNAGNCEYEGAWQLLQQLQQINPNHPALANLNLTQLSQQAAAQRSARVYLRTGKQAIESKDIDGAINALTQGLYVPGVPDCMRQPMIALKTELERRKEFIALTEEVEDATRSCDYDRAQQAIGKITTLRPRYDFINTWISTNVPKMAELLNRKRQAIQLINDANALANQARQAAATEPVDWNNINQIVDRAGRALTDADKVAPKCLKERDRMEQIRQSLLGIKPGKKTQVEASIVLVIDTSGSMSDNNKMTQAKEAAKRAVAKVSKTVEMAVFAFSGGCDVGACRLISDFTTNPNALISGIDGLAPSGGTPMYISVAFASEYAKKNAHGKQAVIVLISDGGDSCRDKQAQAAASIRSSNIPVNTIGFDVGNDQQAQGDMRNLATLTGGRYTSSSADQSEIIGALNLAVLPSLFKDFDMAAAGNAVRGYFDMAKGMIQQNDLNGATFQMQQAYKVAPESPAVNYNLALVYEANDKPLSAIKHAEQYLRLAPQALDRGDIETRIATMQQDVQKNPRAQYDPNSCRDVANWAFTERDTAKRAGNPTRLQAILEIQIAAQRGDCQNAHRLQDSYNQRFH